MTALGDAAARGTATTLGAQLVRFVVQFGSTVVLARLLVPADFGLVAMVAAVIGIAEIFRDFGLSAAAIQSKSLSTLERSNLFWANTGLGVACALLAVLLTPLVVVLYDEPRLTSIVPALAVVFVISGINTQYRSSLTRDLRFGALGMSDIAAQVVGAAVAITLALAGWGVWSLVAQQIAVAVTSLLVNAAHAKWLPRLPRRAVSIRRFLRFGWGFVGTQALMYVSGNVDNVVIGAVWGKSSLGLYSRAFQLLELPLNQINAPLTRVALPILSRVQADRVALARYAVRAQLAVCYVTASAFAVAGALAAPLILVLFGPGWERAAPIFAVLAIGGIFRAVSAVAYWIYLATARTSDLFRLQLWTRPVMIVLIVAGLPWGGVGVAWGYTIGFVFYWAVSLVAVGRKVQIPVRPYFAGTMLVLGVVAGPMAAAAWSASLAVASPVLQLLVGGVAALGAAGLAWLVVPAVRRDAALLIDFARRAFRRA